MFLNFTSYFYSFIYRRNTHLIRKEVTKAIDPIRQAADEILTVSKATPNDLKNTSLTVDDTEILIDGLKLLFQSSDYDEQIRRLTLAPSNWGRLQIKRFFACAQWQSRKALELRNSLGVLAKVTHFVGNQPIVSQMADNIIELYQDDAISCQTSNKKDVIHINRQPIPIRYMSMNPAI